nr:sorting and assembly machinery component 50 [Prosthecochloris sp.]
MAVQALPTPSCVAQKQDRTEPADQPVTVKKISITGNRSLSKEEILEIISTSKKDTFNQEVFDRDIALIKKLYTFKGFFEATVDASVKTDEKKNRVELSILIEEKSPARIDTVRYKGLDNITVPLRKKYLEESKLERDSVFTVDHLIEERDRTVDFFKEYGYAFMHEDSIRIQVDTTGLLAGLQTNISLPKVLEYGSLQVVVHDPLAKDTAAVTPQPKNIRQDSIDIVQHGRQDISSELITNYTTYRPGDTTSLSLERKTLQNFGSTNVFSSVFIRKDSVREGKLYTSIHLEPKPKHLIEPKIYLDNRYGSLFAGASVGYENKNLFGGAENLKVTTDFGMQLSTSNDLLDNLDESLYAKYRPYEFAFSANVAKPELKNPGNMYAGTLEYSRSRLPILLDNQKGLFRLSYNAQLSKKSRLNFDFFELELVKKDSLDGFKELFKTDLAENIGVDPADPVAVDNSLDSLLQTNLNQTFRLQYFHSNQNDPLRETNETVYTWNITLEEVGGLVYLIDEYIDTKSYTGFTNDEPQIFGTPYSQFLKASGQFTFTQNITEQQQIAGRVFLGAMAPYGKADATPDERRFYAGGPNSMRGWAFNTLGPGGNKSEATATLGADIKIETNLEYRLKFFKLFGQPSGIAFFTDVGNIWDRNGPYALTLESLYKDIAWDAGIGLRVGSPIGPFRFDFAYKLYDPTQTEPWQLSDWNPGDFTFNFGIGEPF